MMKIDEELWRTHQYGVLVSFIHHLAYFRCSTNAYKDLQQESEFWTRTIDAHLLRAVIDWCMVFGTDRNSVHWKKVVLDASAQSDFRRSLFSHLSFDQGQWSAYRLTMTHFRNDFAAHRVVSSDYPIVPKMDTALKTVIAYDEWFRDALRDLFIVSFQEPSLSDRYERLMRTSAGPLRELIRRGPSVIEEYEDRPVAGR